MLISLAAATCCRLVLLVFFCAESCFRSFHTAGFYSGHQRPSLSLRTWHPVCTELLWKLVLLRSRVLPSIHQILFILGHLCSSTLSSAFFFPLKSSERTECIVTYRLRTGIVLERFQVCLERPRYNTAAAHSVGYSGAGGGGADQKSPTVLLAA